MLCLSPDGGTVRGSANIDLTGTPFGVAPLQFVPGGHQPRGTAVYSAGNQIVNLTGGGACGHMGPKGGDSGFSLKLEHAFEPPALPTAFTATLQTAAGGNNGCLMFYGTASSENPTRLLWGNGDNGVCGFSSRDELLANKQATWKIRALGDDLYTISDALTSRCLMFYAGTWAESPHRHLWGNGDNGYCGFSSKEELVANKQAVWKIKRIQGNKFTIQAALYDGSANGCLMFYGGAASESPHRHLWSNGDNGSCGLSSQYMLLDNKQAVWTITVQDIL